MRIRPNPYRWNRINLNLFYGRQPLVDELYQRVRTGHSYAIVGGRRMGKTTLLRKLEAELIERLPDSVKAGLIPLPVYVDVLALSQPITPRVVYNEIVTQAEQNLQTIKILPSSWRSLLTLLDQWPGEENRAFREIIKTLVQAVTTGYLQLVVLVDEIEPIVQSPWGRGFFDNWRQFLSNDQTVTPHLAAIFAGAREMRAIAKDIGSPLSNVLTWKELALFTADDTAALVNDPTQSCLPPTIARRVFSQTGGHPFLIQYLMQVICDDDLENAETRLRDASHQFLREQASQFHSWWFDKFEHVDRQVYTLLAERGKAVPRREIIMLVSDVPADHALNALLHTGVIRKTARRESYYVAGTLFKQWFKQYGALIAESGQHDREVEDRLRSLDSQLADRYVTSWRILGTDLPSYSGAVSEIRDTLTQVLHNLAPDDAVIKEPGYTPEKGQARPTRKQRTRFIIRQRRQKGKVTRALENDLDFLETLLNQLSHTVGEAYDFASSRTHVSATYSQAWRCLKQLDSVLAQLLPDRSN